VERSRRAYPVQRSRDHWLSCLMLFLSAVVILSGLIWPGNPQKLTVEPIPSTSPIPLDDLFDDTVEQREIVLPDSVWYALQLGAFEEQQAAHEMSELFSRRGAAGYVWQDDRYRALAAVYPIREDAQSVRTQLKEKHEVDTYLFEIALPAVRLKLSGMKGQLDILEAAFLHGNDLVAELQKLCVKLDRQEISVSEAMDHIASLKHQLDEVALRIQQRFTKPYHPAVEGMLAFMNDFVRFASTADENSSEVSFGTKLKNQTFSSLYLLKKVYDTLCNT